MLAKMKEMREMIEKSSRIATNNGHFAIIAKKWATLGIDVAKERVKTLRKATRQDQMLTKSKKKLKQNKKKLTTSQIKSFLWAWQSKKS